MEKVLVNSLFDDKVFNFRILNELEKRNGDLFYVVEEERELPLVFWNDKFLLLGSNGFISCNEDMIKNHKFKVKTILHNNYIDFINSRGKDAFTLLTLQEQIKVFLGEL